MDMYEEKDTFQKIFTSLIEISIWEASDAILINDILILKFDPQHKFTKQVNLSLALI